MPKFSVKKPLTVFVAVIAVLVLGVVAYLNMPPGLLPNMNFPYIVVMTTYPGASPEKVEAEVSKPMEQSMSTLEHIKEVTSTSSENYSVVMLEFEESVNMDTIGVDIQQKLTALESGWDSVVGSPYVLKINPSMLPVEVAAVAMEGKDTVALTEFLNDTLMPKLEGITGVARVTTSGAVEQKLHVVLDQTKIDRMNRKISDAINGKLDDAANDLQEQRDQLTDAQGQIDTARKQQRKGLVLTCKDLPLLLHGLRRSGADPEPGGADFQEIRAAKPGVGAEIHQGAAANGAQYPLCHPGCF